MPHPPTLECARPWVGQGPCVESRKRGPRGALRLRELGEVAPPTSSIEIEIPLRGAARRRTFGSDPVPTCPTDEGKLWACSGGAMVKREARLTQAPDGEMEMLAAYAAAVRGWRAHGNCSRSLREVVQSSGRASASPALAGSAGSEQEWFRTSKNDWIQKERGHFFVAVIPSFSSLTDSRSRECFVQVALRSRMEALLPPRLQLLTRMVTVGYPASGGLHTRRGSSRGHDLRRSGRSST